MVLARPQSCRVATMNCCGASKAGNPRDECDLRQLARPCCCLIVVWGEVAAAETGTIQQRTRWERPSGVLPH